MYTVLLYFLSFYLALERDDWSLQCGGLKGHSGGRAKSIHSVWVHKSHRGCYSVAARVQWCTAWHWSVAGKVRLPRPRVKVVL